jgi:hypothetical protein
MQSTTAYTVSGTTLTLAGVTSGVKIFVRHLGETLVLPTPADGSVTTAKLGTNSVDGTKIAMGSDAAGDILYHGATDYARLAKGTAGQALVMNTGATAPEWGAAGGGKLLAVVQYTKTDTASTTSTTAATTGLEVTTGTLTTGSKVLVQVSIHVGNSTTEQRTHITLWNGATQLFLGDSGTGHRVTSFFRSMDANSLYNISFMYLHSPGVTTAQTYTVKYHRSTNTTYTSWVNRGNAEDANSGRAASSITAMEIGA